MIRTEVLSALYGHHVDVIRVHDRILVVTGEHDAEHPDPDGAVPVDPRHAEPVP